VKVDVASGRLRGAAFRPSAFHDRRPAGMAISLIVVHGISLPPGRFDGTAVEGLFLGRFLAWQPPGLEDLAGVRVSAHLFIRRDGRVIQFVPFHRRAWHAGVSSFAGQARCNDYSIGIELEGTDTVPYAEIQYERLISVSRHLMRAYPAIQVDRIVGHCDIAPARKTDPGAVFEWGRFRRALAV